MPGLLPPSPSPTPARRAPVGDPCARVALGPGNREQESPSREESAHAQPGVRKPLPLADLTLGPGG